MRKLMRQLWQEEDGQDLIEYALLVALIALALIVSVNGVTSAVSSVFSSAATSLTGTS